MSYSFKNTDQHSFSQSFAAAINAACGRMDQAFRALKLPQPAKLHDHLITEEGSLLLATAASECVKRITIARLHACVAEARQRDIAQKYGGDGRAAFHDLFKKRDAVDPVEIALASMDFSGPAAARNRQQKRQELLQDELRAAGWATQPNIVPTYAAYRQDFLALASHAFR
jgi:hypothetical protein